MCKNAILENDGMLQSVPDQYKIHEICDKVVDNYAHALEFVRHCYKTQKMHHKVINTYPSTIQFVFEYYKTPEMSDNAINTCFLYSILFLIDIRPTKCLKELFPKILLFPNEYKTQKLYDKAVDDCLVVSKLLEKFHDTFFANDDMHYFDQNFSKVIFFANGMGILTVDLDKINLVDDDNF